MRNPFARRSAPTEPAPDPFTRAVEKCLYVEHLRGGLVAQHHALTCGHQYTRVLQPLALALVDPVTEARCDACAAAAHTPPAA